MTQRVNVDPRTLHLPPNMLGGAEPGKLARQLSRHGLSTAGLPAAVAVRDGNGRLQLLDGVTRATRVARWLPGQTIPVDVIDEYPRADFSALPTIGERLP